MHTAAPPKPWGHMYRGQLERQGTLAWDEQGSVGMVNPDAFSPRDQKGYGVGESSRAQTTNRLAVHDSLLTQDYADLCPGTWKGDS